LSDEKMVYYFNVHGGLAVMVDSLYISTTPSGVLLLIQKVLDDQPKLRDDFQREHLYEGLIDFLQSQN